MSDQEKDRKTKKSPQNVKNKDAIKPTKISSGDEDVSKDSETVQQTVPNVSENISKIEISESINDKKNPSEEVEKIVQPEEEIVEEEDVPTLSGWIASGFSSIVKSAKDVSSAVNAVSFNF